ncbi:hypothetical protein NIES2119_10845 [[Phormidium ambiguum] IAM M-71]|uniref:DUF928 domain-containing protein n=1 Tax=[Phormidium ambiguum] IAM M-71 TaxID=454136 RepID=A0A1U7ILI2_9CYAN|nr:DUF928 domain-containing protein [Phormidium ambiguum]OKH38053.1 hypothetical protein NIES2119_10845 [Phormidium ambiguum IAM M-71]
MSKIFHRILSACILTLLLSVVSEAYAGYKAPSTQRAPGGRTSSSGTRGGCLGSAKLPLIALAPQQHIGQTTSTHPTFAWFVPDSSELKMLFSLYEYSANGNIKMVKQVNLKTSPGIMKFSLPKDSPGLTIGKKYLWQIAIICNENYPSNDLVTRAELEVVQLQSNVKTLLDTVKDPFQKVDIYANAGLWYDALDEALKTDNNLQSRKVVTSLLEDLAQIEKSNDLREIATTSRI